MEQKEREDLLRRLNEVLSEYLEFTKWSDVSVDFNEKQSREEYFPLEIKWESKSEVKLGNTLYPRYYFQAKTHCIYDSKDFEYVINIYLKKLDKEHEKIR